MPRPSLKNVAVLLAGGVGTRIGLGIPKQLRQDRRPATILEHTIAAFDAHPQVDEILVLMAPGPPRRRAARSCGTAATPRCVDILEGADTRSQTTMRALDRARRAASATSCCTTRSGRW